jgi:translation initiation factor IF-3
VASAEQKVNLGTASPNVKQELAVLKEKSPELAPAIAKVEAAPSMEGRQMIMVLAPK